MRRAALALLLGLPASAETGRWASWLGREDVLPYRASFEGSAFLSRAAGAGLLERARLLRGDPPGLALTVSVSGAARRALFLAPQADPPRPARLYLLASDGRGRPVDPAALEDPSRIDAALAAALESPEEDIEHPALGDWRDALAPETGLGAAARGRESLERARGAFLTLAAPPPGADAVPPGRTVALAGRLVFVREVEGVPRITHVLEAGRWAPFNASALPRGWNSAPVLQHSGSGPGRTLFCYRFNASGRGARTHQYVGDGPQGAWVPLEEGRPLGLPPAGGTRRLVRSGGGAFLVEFNAAGGARVTHAGSGAPGSALSSRWERGPASFRAGEGSFYYEFRRGTGGAYAAAMTHQRVSGEGGTAGWIRTEGGRPLAAADAQAARRVVTLEAGVRQGRLQAEAQRDRGLAGARAYPRVSGLAASILGPAPAPLSAPEVRGRLPRAEETTLPGGVAAVRVLAPAPGAAPRRRLVVMAGGDAEAAALRRTLEGYQAALTAEAMRVENLLLAATGALLPDQALVVLATHEQLGAALVRVNAEMARAPWIAAGTGALESGQAAQGERALAFPGLFGLRGGIAAGRIEAGARANRGRAQAAMRDSRERAAGLVAQGLEAGRLRAAVEARAGLSAAGIRSVEVAELGDPAAAAAYRGRLGSGGAAIPYVLEGGTAYLLPIGGSADELRLTAAVDIALVALSASHPGGIPRAAAVDAWAAEISRLRGTAADEARRLAEARVPRVRRAL